jgi:hypothetical protein
MTNQKVNTIGEKMTKVTDSFSVNMYDNGFMLEITGRNKDNDYKNVKLMCSTLDELLTVIKEATEMERDN